MKGYVIQKIDTTTRYFKIIGTEKESPVIGETPEYSLRTIMTNEGRKPTNDKIVSYGQYNHRN